MWTQDLTKLESLEVLARTHLGRLACARGMQPYIVPIHYSYHDHWLYSFSVVGQKIEWMRANPLVCIEADQMRREHWASVVVFGRYQELYDTPEFESERKLAFSVLHQRAMWWEHGGAKKTPAGTPAADPVFYRIKLEHITGRCGLSEEVVPATKHAKPDPYEQEWLHRIFRRLRQN